MQTQKLAPSVFNPSCTWGEYEAAYQRQVSSDNDVRWIHHGKRSMEGGVGGKQEVFADAKSCTAQVYTGKRGKRVARCLVGKKQKTLTE